MRIPAPVFSDSGAKFNLQTTERLALRRIVTGALASLERKYGIIDTRVRGKQVADCRTGAAAEQLYSPSQNVTRHLG
jgi:hypothetical protein